LAPSVWFAAAALAAAALLLIWAFLAHRHRVPAEERERRRRLAVNAAGRITDGVITEMHEWRHLRCGSGCHTFAGAIELQSPSHGWSGRDQVPP